MAIAADCLHYWHDWGAGHTSADLLHQLRQCFAYAPGEDRATGYLYAEGEQDWPGPLAAQGPALLREVRHQLEVPFRLVAFQAYRDGSGCGWHADTPFGAQAILSLGVVRTFACRRNDGSGEMRLSLSDGDLVFMPAGFQDGWEHRVPEEDAPGERCSLVFRVPA